MPLPVLQMLFSPFVGATALAVLIITLLIYRRYFSPLSGIPGPFFASFSRLWHLHVTYLGNQNEKLAEAHKHYGPFVRLANNEISVSHPDAIRKVLLAPLEKVIMDVNSRISLEVG